MTNETADVSGRTGQLVSLYAQDANKVSKNPLVQRLRDLSYACAAGALFFCPVLMPVAAAIHFLGTAFAAKELGQCLEAAHLNVKRAQLIIDVKRAMGEITSDVHVLHTCHLTCAFDKIVTDVEARRYRAVGGSFGFTAFSVGAAAAAMFLHNPNALSGGTQSVVGIFAGLALATGLASLSVSAYASNAARLLKPKMT